MGNIVVYPKARLDAIFGVAMTLLVFDVRLPEEFHPRDANDLPPGLLGREPKFLPYVLSFAVLGPRWLSNLHPRSHGETVGREYAEWWLFYHLLITCVPFASMVVGRFVNFAPAIWLYVGDTILIAAVSFHLLALTPKFERADHLHDRRVSLTPLMVSSVLAIGWSFVNPHQALWAFALTAAGPATSRRTAGSKWIRAASAIPALAL